MPVPAKPVAAARAALPAPAGAPTPTLADTPTRAQPARGSEQAPAPQADAYGPRLALAVPASTRLAYQVTAFTKGKTTEGSSELLWRHDGHEYEVMLQVSAPSMPVRTQISSGAITADGLAPKRFSDRSRGEQATHFDRDGGRVVFSSNAPEQLLMAGTQDRLSVMMQIAALVGGDPAKFGPGSTIAIPTATTRDAQEWLFAVDGDESLTLPAAGAPVSIATLKLTRHPRRDFDQRIELWLARGMAYVPVRVRLTNANGDWTDQQWLGTDTRR